MDIIKFNIPQSIALNTYLSCGQTFRQNLSESTLYNLLHNKSIKFDDLPKELQKDYKENIISMRNHNRKKNIKPLTLRTACDPWYWNNSDLPEGLKYAFSCDKIKDNDRTNDACRQIEERIKHLSYQWEKAENAKINYKNSLSSLSACFTTSFNVSDNIENNATLNTAYRFYINKKRKGFNKIFGKKGYDVIKEALILKKECIKNFETYGNIKAMHIDLILSKFGLFHVVCGPNHSSRSTNINNKNMKISIKVYNKEYIFPSSSACTNYIFTLEHVDNSKNSDYKKMFENKLINDLEILKEKYACDYDNQ
jgi:hypothetical protein